MQVAQQICPFLFFKKKNPIFFLFFKICSPRIGLKVVIPDSGQLFLFCFFQICLPLGRVQRFYCLTIRVRMTKRLKEAHRWRRDAPNDACRFHLPDANWDPWNWWSRVHHRRRCRPCMARWERNRSKCQRFYANSSNRTTSICLDCWSHSFRPIGGPNFCSLIGWEPMMTNCPIHPMFVDWNNWLDAYAESGWAIQIY